MASRGVLNAHGLRSVGCNAESALGGEPGEGAVCGFAPFAPQIAPRADPRTRPSPASNFRRQALRNLFQPVPVEHLDVAAVGLGN